MILLSKKIARMISKSGARKQKLMWTLFTRRFTRHEYSRSNRSQQYLANDGFAAGCTQSLWLGADSLACHVLCEVCHQLIESLSVWGRHTGTVWWQSCSAMWVDCCRHIGLGLTRTCWHGCELLRTAKLWTRRLTSHANDVLMHALVIPIKTYICHVPEKETNSIFYITLTNSNASL